MPTLDKWQVIPWSGGSLTRGTYSDSSPITKFPGSEEAVIYPSQESAICPFVGLSANENRCTEGIPLITENGLQLKLTPRRVAQRKENPYGIPL